MKRNAAVALGAAAMLAAAMASAQPALMEPNNSAGSPLDTPPLIAPAPALDTTIPTLSRSESSAAAFQMLDSGGDGYVTRSEFGRLKGGNFEAADLDHDGRVSYDEFQLYWTDVQSGHD